MERPATVIRQAPHEGCTTCQSAGLAPAGRTKIANTKQMNGLLAKAGFRKMLPLTLNEKQGRCDDFNVFDHALAKTHISRTCGAEEYDRSNNLTLLHSKLHNCHQNLKDESHQLCS